MARSITVIPAKQTLTQASTENRLSEKIRVAAYCRVSTDQEEQQSSYENQVSYYRTYIQSNPQYEYVDIYADEGITGTSTKKRDAFNRMIEDCRAHKIDLIITKSISRFARNTLDCLNYVRELKGLGIGIIFEKEYISTALYLILVPNTGLFFAYYSIYCGLVGASEPAHCGLSLICRLNLQ